MTDDEMSITCAADMNAELVALFRRAHANGVDVMGGWECRNDGDLPDWDVVVTEVQKLEQSG